jgi:signal transduction histidine kinase
MVPGRSRSPAHRRLVRSGAVAARANAGQAALQRIAAVAAGGSPPETVFEAVTAEAAALLGGALVGLARFEGDGSEAVVVAQTGDHTTVGVRIPVVGDTTLARLRRTGRAARVDAFGAGPGTRLVTQIGIRAAVSVPVVVEGAIWGALGVSSRRGPVPADAEHRLGVFVEIIAAAVVGAEARESARVLATEQAALLRVAALVAEGAGEAEIFEAVATEAAGLIDDEATTLVRYEGDRTFVVLAHHNGTAPVGLRYRVPEDDAGTSATMLATLRPARLDSYADVADRSYAYRPYRCGSSVTVPIIVDGRLWGAVGVVNEGRALPVTTEARLGKFAELVASALANAAARAELERFGARQAALRRVAELVARGAALDEVFRSVTAEASTILGGAAANLFHYDGTAFEVVATCSSPLPVGERVPAGESLMTGPLLRGRRPLRLASLAGSRSPDRARGLGIAAMVAVPVVAEGRVWGGLSTTTSEGPPPLDAEERLAELAELAAAAIVSAENRAELRASRARVVATADETRQRIQRDVHDGTQQRLVQTVLALKLGLDAADRGEDPVDLVREALEHAERATVELRDIVHGILPPSLARGGLRAGIDSLVATSAMTIDVDTSALPSRRLPGEVEVTAYFVVAEGLTNVAKHARATRARVTVAGDAHALVVEVADDGGGGADPRGGSGLTGLSDRVDALDGTLLLTSTERTGTTLRVVLPLPGDGAEGGGAEEGGADGVVT